MEIEKDYYEIRLESIGGLGANLCGKMLGELGIKYLDVNSSSFSSYGSEKTGTPVKSYIRFCKKEKEIRVHSPIINPDLLVIFHQALLKDGNVLKGCTDNTLVIVAMESLNNLPEISCNIKGLFGIEAQKIAIDTHSRINVVMLGAILKVMGIEDVAIGEKMCKDTLGKKYPEALEGNIKGLKRGYEEVNQLPVSKTQKETKKKSYVLSLGYDNAPIGGINLSFGNTVTSDLSPSRQGYIPLFIKERCINCGKCNATCPDMVFQFEEGEDNGRKMMINKGLDYYHCKGCLRCVDICPVNALVMGKEAEHANKKYFVTNKELIRKPEYYEEAGADGYITSEAYLAEKRVEGGEV